MTRVSNTEIEGYATYYNAFTGYSLQQYYTLYFVLQFSKPFDSMGGWVNEGVKPVNGYIGGWNRNHQFDTPAEIHLQLDSIRGKGDAGVFVNYRTTEGEQILVRSGISLVDMNGARHNLEQELTGPFGWDFDRDGRKARSVWNEYLGRVEIKTDDYLQRKNSILIFIGLWLLKQPGVMQMDVSEMRTNRFAGWRVRTIVLSVGNIGILFGTISNYQFGGSGDFFEMGTFSYRLYQNSGWFNTDPAGVEHTGVMVAMHPISQI